MAKVTVTKTTTKKRAIRSRAAAKTKTTAAKTKATAAKSAELKKKAASMTFKKKG